MDIEPFRHFVIVMGLSVVRLATACMVAPFLGRQVMSPRVRNSINFSLILVLYPLVEPTIPPTLGAPLVAAAVLAKEAVLGLTIGFLASLAFWRVMCVGALIDTQRGALMAAVYDPMRGEETTPLGQFLMHALVTLFYVSGGFLVFLGVVFESYLIWPVYAALPSFSGAFPGFMLEQLDDLMKMTVVLAAPVVLTMFTCEVGLALINRFAPQLDVFFLGMPINSAVGFFVLILYLPLMFCILGDEFAQGRAPLDALKAMLP